GSNRTGPGSRHGAASRRARISRQQAQRAPDLPRGDPASTLSASFERGPGGGEIGTDRMQAQASPTGSREAGYPASLTAGLTARRIPGLDGMRALGSFAVIAYHYTPRWAPGGLGVMNFLVL